MPKINGGFATSFVVIAASFGNAAAVCGPGACDDSATWSTYSISVQVGKCPINGIVCGYRCQQNYYGTGSACSKCPSYLSIEGITSGPGTTEITSCYISKDATITDVTGQYTVFAQDCYYTEPSAPNPPSWSRHEIQEKLLEILNEQLGANIQEIEFTYETRWEDIWISTGADSLDVVDFMMAIEEEFGIEVREEDLQNMQTVLDTIAYIEKELG